MPKSARLPCRAARGCILSKAEPMHVNDLEVELEVVLCTLRDLKVVHARLPAHLPTVWAVQPLCTLRHAILTGGGFTFVCCVMACRSSESA